MSYEVLLDKFSGPLHLLLGLIEREELPITEVSLAKVTEDYLKHLQVNEVPTEELADFLVIAAKLLLIKSHAILPVPIEEEEDASTLAAQLRMYKTFVDASRHIETLCQSGKPLFARERLVLAAAAPTFSPPGNVSPQSLKESFVSLLKRLEPFFALRRVSLERVVSVQERIRQIREAILERSRLTFNEMVSTSASKVDVVVSFLALLELVKQRVVHAVQKESFQDITISHVE